MHKGVCMEVHGGMQRGAQRCSAEVHRGVWRCVEGCVEVRGAVHRGVCGGVKRGAWRYTEGVRRSVEVHGGA